MGGQTEQLVFKAREVVRWEAQAIEALAEQFDERLTRVLDPD